MSRAVSEMRRWRGVEWAGGSRDDGVPRSVIRCFLWSRGRYPKRYALFIGSRRTSLKRQETVGQPHKLLWMQQGYTPVTAEWGEPGDGIRRPGRQGQHSSVRMRHNIFEQVARPADVTQGQGLTTQGMHRISDGDRA